MKQPRHQTGPESAPDRPALRRMVCIPIPVGEETVVAEAITFRGLQDKAEHIALGVGPWRSRLARQRIADAPMLVRLHSECLTGDLFGSLRCDCGSQLQEALRLLSKEGGLLLYLRQEGRGIGLYAKLDAYALQDGGLDTFDANAALGYPTDGRDYTVAAQMLEALGVQDVELITNSPDKLTQLIQCGVNVVGYQPTWTHITPHNVEYLRTKAERAGHRLALP